MVLLSKLMKSSWWVFPQQGVSSAVVAVASGTEAGTTAVDPDTACQTAAAVLVLDGHLSEQGKTTFRSFMMPRAEDGSLGVSKALRRVAARSDMEDGFGNIEAAFVALKAEMAGTQVEPSLTASVKYLAALLPHWADVLSELHGSDSRPSTTSSSSSTSQLEFAYRDLARLQDWLYDGSAIESRLKTMLRKETRCRSCIPLLRLMKIYERHGRQVAARKSRGADGVTRTSPRSSRNVRLNPNIAIIDDAPELAVTLPSSGPQDLRDPGLFLDRLRAAVRAELEQAIEVHGGTAIQDVEAAMENWLLMSHVLQPVDGAIPFSAPQVEGLVSTLHKAHAILSDSERSWTEKLPLVVLLKEWRGSPLFRALTANALSMRLEGLAAQIEEAVIPAGVALSMECKCRIVGAISLIFRTCAGLVSAQVAEETDAADDLKIALSVFRSGAAEARRAIGGLTAGTNSALLPVNADDIKALMSEVLQGDGTWSLAEPWKCYLADRSDRIKAIRYCIKRQETGVASLQAAARAAIDYLHASLSQPLAVVGKNVLEVAAESQMQRRRCILTEYGAVAFLVELVDQISFSLKHGLKNKRAVADRKPSDRSDALEHALIDLLGDVASQLLYLVPYVCDKHRGTLLQSVLSKPATPQPDPEADDAQLSRDERKEKLLARISSMADGEDGFASFEREKEKLRRTSGAHHIDNLTTMYAVLPPRLVVQLTAAIQCALKLSKYVQSPSTSSSLAERTLHPIVRMTRQLGDVLHDPHNEIQFAEDTTEQKTGTQDAPSSQFTFTEPTNFARAIYRYWRLGFTQPDIWPYCETLERQLEGTAATKPLLVSPPTPAARKLEAIPAGKNHKKRFKDKYNSSTPMLEDSAETNLPITLVCDPVMGTAAGGSATVQGGDSSSSARSVEKEDMVIMHPVQCTSATLLQCMELTFTKARLLGLATPWSMTQDHAILYYVIGLNHQLPLIKEEVIAGHPSARLLSELIRLIGVLPSMYDRVLETLRRGEESSSDTADVTFRREFNSQWVKLVVNMSSMVDRFDILHAADDSGSDSQVSSRRQEFEVASLKLLSTLPDATMGDESLHKLVFPAPTDQRCATGLPSWVTQWFLPCLKISGDEGAEALDTPLLRRLRGTVFAIIRTYTTYDEREGRLQNEIPQRSIESHVQTLVSTMRAVIARMFGKQSGCLTQGGLEDNSGAISGIEVLRTCFAVDAQLTRYLRAVIICRAASAKLERAKKGRRAGEGNGMNYTSDEVVEIESTARFKVSDEGRHAVDVLCSLLKAAVALEDAHRSHSVESLAVKTLQLLSVMFDLKLCRGLHVISLRDQLALAVVHVLQSGPREFNSRVLLQLSGTVVSWSRVKNSPSEENIGNTAIVVMRWVSAAIRFENASKEDPSRLLDPASQRFILLLQEYALKSTSPHRDRKVGSAFAEVAFAVAPAVDSALIKALLDPTLVAANLAFEKELDMLRKRKLRGDSMAREEDDGIELEGVEDAAAATSIAEMEGSDATPLTTAERHRVPTPRGTIKGPTELLDEIHELIEAGQNRIAVAVGDAMAKYDRAIEIGRQLLRSASSESASVPTRSMFAQVASLSKHAGRLHTLISHVATSTSKLRSGAVGPSRSHASLVEKSFKDTIDLWREIIFLSQTWLDGCGEGNWHYYLPFALCIVQQTPIFVFRTQTSAQHLLATIESLFVPKVSSRRVEGSSKVRHGENVVVDVAQVKRWLDELFPSSSTGGQIDADQRESMLIIGSILGLYHSAHLKSDPWPKLLNRELILDLQNAGFKWMEPPDTMYAEASPRAERDGEAEGFADFTLRFVAAMAILRLSWTVFLAQGFAKRHLGHSPMDAWRALGPQIEEVVAPLVIESCNTFLAVFSQRSASTPETGGNLPVVPTRAATSCRLYLTSYLLDVIANSFRKPTIQVGSAWCTFVLSNITVCRALPGLCSPGAIVACRPVLSRGHTVQMGNYLQSIVQFLGSRRVVVDVQTKQQGSQDAEPTHSARGAAISVVGGRGAGSKETVKVTPSQLVRAIEALCVLHGPWQGYKDYIDVVLPMIEPHIDLLSSQDVILLVAVAGVLTRRKRPPPLLHSMLEEIPKRRNDLPWLYVKTNDTDGKSIHSREYIPYSNRQTLTAIHRGALKLAVQQKSPAAVNADVGDATQTQNASASTNAFPATTQVFGSPDGFNTDTALRLLSLSSQVVSTSALKWAMRRVVYAAIRENAKHLSAIELANVMSAMKEQEHCLRPEDSSMAGKKDLSHYPWIVWTLHSLQERALVLAKALGETSAPVALPSVPEGIAPIGSVPLEHEVDATEDKPLAA